MPLRHTEFQQEALVNKNFRLAKSVLLLCLTLIAVLLAAVAPARAQETTASITGFVTDPSGAAVAGATVTATDTERGIPWTTTTNDAGSYNFPRVPIGTYGMKVESKGPFGLDFHSVGSDRNPRKIVRSSVIRRRRPRYATLGVGRGDGCSSHSRARRISDEPGDGRRGLLRPGRRYGCEQDRD